MREKIGYSIAPQIFGQFPQYVRGVVLVNGADNTDASPPELVAMLRRAENDLRACLGVPSVFDLHPQLQNWREAYRVVGINPNQYRPSVDALARRILQDPGIELPSISPLVDIGNIISLRQLVPIGVHALEFVENDLLLCRADGSEQFTPFGTNDKVEQPKPNEIIFTDGSKVLTRRWTWRQSTHTLTIPQSRYVEFNVDALPPVDCAKVAEICDELAKLVTWFCGGAISCTILSMNNPSTVLTLKKTIVQTTSTFF
jgi:DNA/RNA-binding domain of Phe-tRNA-synthetase-like protein